MKKLLVASILTLLALTMQISSAYAVYVNGYYRSNGTYVNGYQRTAPDGNPYNNYSFPGNYNPNTGNITGGSVDTYLNNYYKSSGSSYSSPIYSSYTSSYPTMPIAPTTPTCPSNSYLNGTSCKCNYGYSVSGGSCVSNDSQCQSQIGYNSSYDSLNNTCKCGYGYVIGNSGQCTNATLYCSAQMGLMSQYDSSTKQCECMSGYEYNGSSCEYKQSSYNDYSSYSSSSSNTCPINSSINQTDNKCYCNSGYSIDSSKTSCMITAPATANTVTCPPGYTCTTDPSAPQIGDCPAGYTCTVVKQSDTKAPSPVDVVYNAITRNLKVGDSGEDVGQLQGFLEEQGFLILPSGTNPGYFGNLTKEAVKSFQKKNNIPATGEFRLDMKSLLNN